jgi:transposase-like protein
VRDVSVKQVARMLRRGLGQAVVARSLRVSTATVCRRAKCAGVRRRTHPPVTREESVAIQQLYEEGCSIRGISRILKRSQGLVRRSLMNQGLLLRGLAAHRCERCGVRLCTDRCLECEARERCRDERNDW